MLRYVPKYPFHNGKVILLNPLIFSKLIEAKEYLKRSIGIKGLMKKEKIRTTEKSKKYIFRIGEFKQEL